MTEKHDREKKPFASFVTCVSDPALYEKYVVDSLNCMDRSCGAVERIAVDNRAGEYSAAQALNQGLDRSSGDLVVLCHQDVRFPPDWLANLRIRIEEVGRQEPAWGVIGMAGRCADGSISGHIMHPSGPWHYPPLPRRVQSLDELCLVLRKETGLRFDEYLDHFHLYGADLCLESALRGMPVFAVDCCIEHRSEARRNEHWLSQKEKFIKKWWPRRNQVGKKIYLTSGSIRLHSPLVRLIRRIFKPLRKDPLERRENR